MIVNKQDLKKGVKYTFEQVGHLLEDKFKDRAKPQLVSRLGEIDKESFENFLIIGEKIKSVGENIYVFARGSRISKNHLPNSDYDILVICNSQYVEEIKKIEFPVKVDIFFRPFEGFLIEK